MHLALFPAPEEIYPAEPARLLAEWERLFAVRDAALLVLEEARQEKRIGKGLEADLEIRASGELLVLLNSHAHGLKEILNVSAVRVVEGSENERSDVAVTALPAAGSKCARCWNFMPEVSNYGIWENVCTRCHDALTTMGVEPPTESEDAA